jgi:signal peptidase I
MSEEINEAHNMKYKKTIIYSFSSCIIILLLVFIVRHYVKLGEIRSNSMYPAYKKGEYIIYSTNVDLRKIKRFDLIFFWKNDNFSFKRIIGLPEDKIIFLNDSININNKKLKIPKEIKIIFDKKNKLHKNNTEFIVPQKSFFVIGDNLPESFDSRFYGSIQQSKIEGTSWNKENRKPTRKIK